MNRSKIKYNLICCIFSFVLLISASASDTQVYVGGMPFGINFHAGEVSVIRTNSFVSSGETVSPADEAGIMASDIITHINDKEINSIKDFVGAADTSSGDTLDITVKRGEKEFKAKLTPKMSDETGRFMLGIMLKDSSAGIGTVTFIKDDSLLFAGLGHGICDPASGEILKIDSGYISKVKINGITKGSCGAPGELRGSLDAEKCGKLLSNTEVGVYGVFTSPPQTSATPIYVAEINEVKTGKATILCTLDDNKCNEYDIEISQINHDTDAKTKNYVIKVTDKRLLEKTGGIVQGMSGSPIIQNGKLVGAVTHVMINDPTTGYGIYIGNMLSQAV